MTARTWGRSVWVLAILLAIVALLTTENIWAAEYPVNARFPSTGDPDIDVTVRCDLSSAPVTVRGTAADPTGVVTFTIEANGGETLRCTSQGQRLSDGESGGLSAEVSRVVPLPRPGEYPLTIEIGRPN